MFKNFFFRYRLAVICSVLLFVVAGYLTLNSLPISLFPKSVKPTVRMTVMFDFDSIAFKEEIGKKIERSLLNLEKVKRIESHYDLKKAVFSIHFDWEKEPNQAVNEVTSVASFYQTELPNNFPPIRVDYIDPGIENYVVVSSDELDAKTLSELLAKQVGPVLNEMEGMLHYMITEVNKEQVLVNVDPLLLMRHNLSISDVVNALNNSRFDTNIGMIRNDKNASNQYVFLTAKASSVEDLNHLVLTKRYSQPVYLRDVADVTFSIGEQDRSYFIGENLAVAIAAWPKPEVNLYKFSKEFKNVLNDNLSGIGDVIPLNDPLSYIDHSLKQVTNSVLLGMLFSAIAVLFAFKSMNLTMLIAVIMPISLVTSAVLLKLLGVGLNIISLSAMSVAIGLVVDNAIVMIDSIVTNLNKRQPKSNNDLVDVIIDSVKQVKLSILGSSLTTIVVFLPLIFTMPIVYSLVGELAIVVVCILIFSVFVSLFFLPSIIVTYCLIKNDHSWLLRKNNNKKNTLIIFYQWLVYFIVKNRLATWGVILVIVCSIVVSTYLIIAEVIREIVANPKPNIIDISLNFSSVDFSQQAREIYTKKVRQKVMLENEKIIKHVFSDIRKNVSYISLHLVDFNDADLLMSKLKKSLKDTTYYTIDISPWVSAKLQVPNIPDFRIYATGKTNEEKRLANIELNKRLRSLQGVKRSNIYPKSSTHTRLTIDLNRSIYLASLIGVDFLEEKDRIIDYVKYSTEERFLYMLKMPHGDVPLNLLLTDKRVTSAQELGDIPIQKNKKIMSLRHLLSFKNDKKWTEYYSRNGTETYMTEVWTVNENKVEYSKKIHDVIYQIEKTMDIKFIISDTKGEINNNIKSLLFALIAAVFLVIVTLLFINQSLLYTSIILASIPLGFMGASFALYLFASTVSVSSLIGMLLLIGLTINNAILITDKYRWLKEQASSSISHSEIIAEACVSRIRATSVTTFTTVFTMLPIAIGIGSNGSIMQPLGIAVSSGMIISLISGLLLTPALLSFLPTEIEREESLRNSVFTKQ